MSETMRTETATVRLDARGITHVEPAGVTFTAATVEDEVIASLDPYPDRSV